MPVLLKEENFAKSILRLKLKHGRDLSNQEIADMLGISIAAYYRFKKGGITIQTLDKICSLLNKQPAYFIKHVSD